MLTAIIREASLLPEDDFSETIDRAFQRGLGHKLSPARPYDELAATFAPGVEAQIGGSEYNTPWDCSEGTFVAHGELGRKVGPGPTFSRDQADDLLQTRYQNLAKGLRITIPMLAASEGFRETIETGLCTFQAA